MVQASHAYVGCVRFLVNSWGAEEGKLDLACLRDLSHEMRNARCVIMFDRETASIAAFIGSASDNSEMPI